MECDEFVGWVHCDIAAIKLVTYLQLLLYKTYFFFKKKCSDGNPFRVFWLQIVILNTHLNGRDTHIRQVKVYSVIPSHLDEEPKEKEQEQVIVKKSLVNKGLR